MLIFVNYGRLGLIYRLLRTALRLHTYVVSVNLIVIYPFELQEVVWNGIFHLIVITT